MVMSSLETTGLIISLRITMTTVWWKYPVVLVSLLILHDIYTSGWGVVLQFSSFLLLIKQTVSVFYEIQAI